MKLPKGPFSNLPDDDCDRPACDDTVSALNAALARAQLSKDTQDTASSECPPNSAQLGQSTWNLLHSMAAWYPDQPTQEDERHITSFMSALARFYPCTWCARDFQENLGKKPVEAKSRKELCVWVCEQHNIVNQKLGKPVFPCDIKKLDERWRKSTDPKCQSDH